MTDSKDVFLNTPAIESVQCRMHRRVQPHLVVRCKEGKTSLFITMEGCHMASSESFSWGHVTYRLDADKAATVPMNASSDHSALGLWSGTTAVPLIKRMFGKSALLARMTPYSESAITVNFNIAGLEQAITPLRQACKW